MITSGLFYVNIVNTFEQNDELFDPVNFPFFVLILGIVGTLGSLIVVSVFVFFLLSSITREIKSKNAKKIPTKEIKQKYLSVISQIESMYNDSLLKDDGVFYELSRAIKNYSSEKTGENVSAMTKSDIEKEKEFKQLFKVIDKMYFSEFSKTGIINSENSISAVDAIELSKKLVMEW